MRTVTALIILSTCLLGSGAASLMAQAGTAKHPADASTTQTTIKPPPPTKHAHQSHQIYGSVRRDQDPDPRPTNQEKIQRLHSNALRYGDRP